MQNAYNDIAARMARLRMEGEDEIVRGNENRNFGDFEQHMEYENDLENECEYEKYRRLTEKQRKQIVELVKSFPLLLKN